MMIHNTVRRMFSTLAKKVPLTVNFHVLRECSSRCTFCFATFADNPTRLSSVDAVRLIDLLAQAGAARITFVGGEPTLHPSLHAYITQAKKGGMEASVVSNGMRLTQLLDVVAGELDWVGLSLDSVHEEVEIALGRANGRLPYVERVLSLAARVRDLGIRLKLNTVVTKLNIDEDMSDTLLRLRPERWKVFQILLVAGENDVRARGLSVSRSAFDDYVRRHQRVATAGICIVPEHNDRMTGSYIMVDPVGRFFSNATGSYVYSRPILSVGVDEAFGDVGFEVDTYVDRGGVIGPR